MHNKETITQAVLELCVGVHKPTLEEALLEWWQNPKDDAGLRLTVEGFFVFNLVEIESFKFPLPPKIYDRPSTLLTLSRKMTCPYYITPGTGKKPEIYIYGGKEASMFALYGDVEKFLRGIAR
jgi:hypothetical protein